ncbi:MAG: PilN domain-containing protein [Pseudomonadota bacterium]|nr:PilN domain-containing protein [Pseudomonadota bacterium]
MSASGINRLGIRLGNFGARLGPRPGGLLAWWGHSLASWLSPRMRQALGFDRGRLLLQADGGELQLRLQRGDTVRDLGRVPVLETPGSGETAAVDPLALLLTSRVAALPRWLILPASSALRRRLVLPPAAAERLRDVVGFEIDRQTPFSADAVAFDARVLRRRDSDGQLDVEMIAVPRSVIDPQVTTMGPLAATLAGIDVAGADGAPLGVNLLAPLQRSVHRDPWRGWNVALAMLAVLLVAAMLWQMLANRRAAAAAFEQRISAQADEARFAAAQRQQLINLIEGQAFLDEARASRPPTIAIIDELSRRLPDGTYLEKLTIDGKQLLLIGLSNEAAALVGRMQSAELWQRPALAGALQPDPASGRDRFTLTAGLDRSATAAPPSRPLAPEPTETSPSVPVDR